MDADRLARLEELFHAVADLPDDERRSFLEKQCADDPTLIAEVEALLAAEHKGSTIAPVQVQVDATVMSQADDVRDEIPTHIGPYEVIASIGQGGFAVVYSAEQKQPVRRRVAVKVLKAGLDSGALLARFEAERQALAMMDHPSIAQVYDAGRTESGRSYFVMELVDGRPIQEYCDEHQLDLRERVELLITVCQAVQHAHQKGVIHRDLKPSNILVTTVDGKPLPKVIDFGIAKAMGAELGGGTMLTQMGQFVGTPEYSSPEQADPGSRDVDTRSDVYSLGVVAYELLTGQLPFPRESLLRAGLVEVLRILREVEPPSPSTRISTLAGAASAAATQRRTTTNALRKQLQGDLDWIVLKALEKERDRRYETANGLAADLRRFLAGDAVLAGPPSVRYRAGKFLRRHRLAVGSATGLVLLLMAFAATLVVQNQHIRTARDKATEEARTAARVSEFLASLFQFSDPGKSRGRDVSARQLLDEGAQRLREELQDEPVVRANLLTTMGRVYRRIDELPRAAEFLEEAASLREREYGNDRLETVFARVSLGIVYTRLDRLAEAESLLVRSLADLERLTGLENENAQRTATALAQLYEDQERYDDALPLMQQAYEIRSRIHGPRHRDALYAKYNLGALQVLRGRDDLAEPLIRESLRELRVVRGEDHPNTLRIMVDMARLDARQGRYDEAVALIEEALAGQIKVHGEGSSDVAFTRATLERVRREMSGGASEE